MKKTIKIFLICLVTFTGCALLICSASTKVYSKSYNCEWWAPGKCWQCDGSLQCDHGFIGGGCCYNPPRYPVYWCDAYGKPQAGPCSPYTSIELSEFYATSYNREVVLNWSTEAEIDNAGYNIYRSESKDGEYLKINELLIPAQGSSTQGASYEFIDKNAKNRKTYWYKLEDLDFNGISTFHGPVSAMPLFIFGFGK